MVLDVGAHVGYFTLIMSRRVGPGGEVHAFEPRKLNRRFLKTHLRLNAADNVRVYSLSIGDRVGPVRFETRTGSGTGHVSDSGNVTVRMTDHRRAGSIRGGPMARPHQNRHRGAGRCGLWRADTRASGKGFPF